MSCRMRIVVSAVAAVTAVLVVPEIAHACASCFGNPDAAMTQGLNKAILALLGFVGLVQVGIVKVMWDIRKRTRKKVDPIELRLIRGGE